MFLTNELFVNSMYIINHYALYNYYRIINEQKPKSTLKNKVQYKYTVKKIIIKYEQVDIIICKIMRSKYNK